MTIIDQLEQTVTPAVLGNTDSVAHITLLEEFYAMLVARLALPQVYSQLLRTDSGVATENAPERSLFEQLWPDPSMRQLIVQNMAATHHIDDVTTAQLLRNAAPLVYSEIKVLAHGQFVPAFLQAQQATIRPYLPIWSAPMITAAQEVDNESLRDSSIIVNTETLITTPIDRQDHQATTVDVAIINSATEPTIAIVSEHPNVNTDAIHANPSDYHLAENKTKKQATIRTRNRKNDLLVRIVLLVAAIASIGLVWALLIKPNQVAQIDPSVATPVIISPTNEPPPQVLTPVELIVGIDNSGSLYTCSASVGDASLQAALQQTLNTSFGEQAGICEVTVQVGTATSIPSMSIETLPNILTLLRAIPFARLHLQNDRMTLEAPDSMLLQRLITDIRTLAPAMTIDSTAPLPLPNNNNAMSNNNNGLETNNMGDGAGLNNQFETENSAINNQYNNANNVGGVGDYQAPDDNTGDTMVPAPSRNNIQNNNRAANNTFNAPAGPISLSEVEDMASNMIVAEPAQVNRPTNSGTGAN